MKENTCTCTPVEGKGEGIENLCEFCYLKFMRKQDRKVKLIAVLLSAISLCLIFVILRLIE